MGATVFDCHPHDENLAAYWQAYGQAEGSSVTRSGSDVAFFTGIPLALFNAAIVNEGSRDSICNLHSHLSEKISVHSVSARWWVSPNAQNKNVAGTLNDLGIKPVGRHPTMEMEVADFVPSAKVKGLTIRTAKRQVERADWAYRLCHFFGFSEEVSLAVSAVEAAIPDDRLTGQYRYLAYFGDQPVAASSLVLAGGLAGIYAVATDADLRGRGIGTAITEHAMLAGQSMGASRCILHATDMGKPVYERIGFRTVFEYELFQQDT